MAGGSNALSASIQRVSWRRFVQNINVRALRERVNTGVRSSGAVNAHSLPVIALKGALEMILHRVAMRLALPAGEWCAVVSDDYFQSSRHGNLVMSDR